MLRRCTLVSFLVFASSVGCAQEPLFDLGGTTGAAGPGSQTTGGSGGDSGGQGGESPDTSSSANAGSGGAPVAGGATSGAGGEAPTGTFIAVLDDEAPSIELRAQADLTITLAADGDVGPVELSVVGLPDDVAAELDQEALTLLDGSETVGLTLRSASNTQTGSFQFTVLATSAGGDASAVGMITVEPVLTVVLPQDLAAFGLDNPPNTEAFGDYPTMVRARPDNAPVEVRFFNGDGVDHEIHAGSDGFGHGQGPFGPGELDFVERTVTAPGNYDFYPHDIGQSILGRITVE